MKKMYLLAFIFILTACSTQPIQATVTRFATMTATLPPPTATVLPTPTLTPQFLAIQTQVAATENYTIMGNGNVEGKLPDGTIGVVPGVHLNPDGKGYTIIVNGAPVVIGADKVSINDNGISIDGYTFDVATGNFTEGFSLESWAPTTEHGAEFVSNLNLWNVPQEIQDSIKCEGNLCYDADENVIFDASTGQYGLDFLHEALSAWGGVGGPQEKPDPTASRLNYPNLNGKIPKHSLDISKLYRANYIQEYGSDPFGDIGGDGKRDGRVEWLLLENNKWAYVYGKSNDGNTVYDHLAYTPAEDPGGIVVYKLLPTSSSQYGDVWKDKLPNL